MEMVGSISGFQTKVFIQSIKLRWGWSLSEQRRGLRNGSWLNENTSSSIEEIEAKLRHANLLRQEFEQQMEMVWSISGFQTKVFIRSLKLRWGWSLSGDGVSGKKKSKLNFRTMDDPTTITKSLLVECYIPSIIEEIGFLASSAEDYETALG
ncbi:hypothetical protein ACOSP7_027643 [Xanthoceras sorbifolium]